MTMWHFHVIWISHALCFFSLTLCCSWVDPCTEPRGCEYVEYDASSEHIVNPSRGFADLMTTRLSAFSPLTKSRLDGIRLADGVTIAWRQYVLDTHVENDIEDDVLDLIRADLDIVRNARFTVLLRFMYTDTQVDEAPYGDATKSWMLRHISQLSPIFYEYEDVLDVVQAGFIGIWGEWYYTTDFGDPDYLDYSDPENHRGLTPENWQDRREVLFSLLDNMPESIQAEVRVPTYKQATVDDWSPTTYEEVQQNIYKARIGHHNDCFLASSTDFGTYENKSAEYPYLQEDTLFTVMGGETCSLSTSPEEPDRHRCPTAELELSELHFSYLNQNYNQDVLDTWKEDGCYDDIHRELGYRLVLIDGVYSTGPFLLESYLHVHIELRNAGYAAPYRSRDIMFILRGALNDEVYSAVVPDVDTRLWWPDQTITIQTSIYIPDTIQPADYELMFMLRDSRLADFSDYNTLMANNGIPRYSWGVNSLLHHVQIASGHAGEVADDCPVFQPAEPQQLSGYDRLYCGETGCDTDDTCVNMYVENYSFEEDGGWDEYGLGFTYSEDTASHGIRSAKVEDGGVYQVWQLPPGTRQMLVKADSYSVGVTSSETPDYAIYCDIKLADGSWSYGHLSPFSPDIGDWHQRVLTISLSQDMDEAWCYGMFRNLEGTAYFDYFLVCTSQES